MSSGVCKKRTTYEPFHSVETEHGTMTLAIERQYEHDWREAIAPGYQVCGACGAIRKRKQPAAGVTTTTGEGSDER